MRGCFFWNDLMWKAAMYAAGLLIFAAIGAIFFADIVPK